MNKNKKVCRVCGKPFYSPPSDKKVTCSQECRKEYAKMRSTGRKFDALTRKKISDKAKRRDMSSLQKIATEAALESPRSGRFETNINAIDWHLISPDGKHYYIHSLQNWLRENGLELFGCNPDSREFENVRSGLSGAKRAMLGGKYACTTYKGWQVIPSDQEYLNAQIKKRGRLEI